MTGGVPQGSSLHPLLWSIINDGIFRVKVPKEAEIIGFVDYIAVIVVVKFKEEVEEICNSTIRIIVIWLNSAGLELATHKTEAIFTSGRKVKDNILVAVNNISSQSSLRYVVVIID